MVTKPKTLIVESDESGRTFLQQSLEGAGYLTTAVDTASEALSRLRNTPFDLVLTALELDEGPDGLRVAKAVKWRWPRTPVIITARNGSFDTAKAAIDLGVDGYLLKPIESADLKDTAQKALERQRACHCTEGTQVLRWRGLALDKRKAEATLNGEPVDLTPTEFKLLRYLMENDYRVVSSVELFEASHDRPPQDRKRARDAIRWHIYNIRQKIEPDPQDPVYVLNVYGLGYTFADAETQ
jgi:DNA-binding response OmpR family regulator